MLLHALLMCVGLTLASAGKYTSHCKTTSTLGYDYKKFYYLSPNKGNSGNFILNFKVKTANDAHILLSTTPFPGDGDPVVEIVIGGWGNSQSVMRSRKQGSPLSGGQKDTRNIVSKYGMTGFWVKSNQGDLSVGRERSNEAVMRVKDPHNANYKYFSFSSWNDGVSATWLYDCTTTYSNVCTIN